MTPILDISHVSFAFDRQPVLTDVSLQIYPNDFVAIIGPNGGGKSTLIKLITGLFPIQSGRISVFGAPPRKSRHLIGYLPQYIDFDRSYPIQVIDVVCMATLSKGIFRFFKKDDREQAMANLAKFGVEHLADRPFVFLSGGEKQRVLLARALMNSPRLLILDEPTTGVDSKTQSDFYALLHELNHDMAIVMVSHDLSAVSQHVKTIACLNQKCVYHGTKELNKKDLEAAYGCDIELIAHGTPHRVVHHHD